jgi:hypothetical protein
MNQIVSASEPASVQWSELIDIHDVEPLGENDYGCLEEIRDVLKRHGKQERFGVMLVHKHFDVAADEVMMEYTDIASRVQTIKPIKKAELTGNSIQTSWILQDGGIETMLACNTQCWKNIHGNHVTNHV